MALERRRLQELPAASSTRFDYVPVPSALVELRGTINERPIALRDRWSYAAIGLSAAARREVAYPLGSLTGGGEQIDLGWRFWPGRPRVSAALISAATMVRFTGLGGCSA